MLVILMYTQCIYRSCFMAEDCTSPYWMQDMCWRCCVTGHKDMSRLDQCSVHVNSDCRLASCSLFIRVRMILVLGYWVLGNIHRYWVVLVVGRYFFLF